MKGKFIKELTYAQCQEIINEDTILVLPIGGGSKEHGSHLPMGTDLYVTEYVANMLTQQCNVLTLPVLPYAYFPAFIQWKGSVSISADNFMAFVEDIILSFSKFGVKKVLIIDGGVSTHIPLKILSLTMNNKHGVKVAVSNCLGLGYETSEEICQQEKGGHGDEGETSTMLYINESLVHMQHTVEEYNEIPIPGAVKGGIERVYVPFRMNTPSGTNGNSKLATKEKGKKILDAMVADLVGFVEAFDKWQWNES